MNKTEMTKTIIRKANEARLALIEADKACDANPIVDGRNLKGYVALKATYDALIELIVELGLVQKFNNYVNESEKNDD